MLDNSDIDAMLRIIYEERGLTLRAMTFSAARDMIEIRKLKKEPQYYLDLITLSLESAAAEISVRPRPRTTSFSMAISTSRRNASGWTTTIC